MFYAIDGASDLPKLTEFTKPSSLKDKIIRKLGKPIITDGDVHPGDVAPVMALSRSGRVTVFPMVWGVPNRGLTQYQMPAEAASRIFPESWATRRCEILSSYYYQKPDDPENSNLYAVQPKGSFVCYMAGLYVLPEDGFPHFIIISRKASEDTENLASRMPVVITETSHWLDQGYSPERILRQKPPRMIYVRARVQGRPYYA